jgi:hypothetical protein
VCVLTGAHAARIEVAAAHDRKGEDQAGADSSCQYQAPPHGGYALFDVHGSLIFNHGAFL